MKLPYVISNNSRRAYKTSFSMRNSPGEVSRRIVAEDFTWDESITPPPLSYFAALTLSQIFHRVNPLNNIMQKDIDILMEMYPDTIPLKYSVPLITDEHYWKKSFLTKFPTILVHGVENWKCKYLSVSLQQYLELAKPNVFPEDEAAELAALVSPYVVELKLSQMQMVRQPRPPFPSEVIEDTCEFSVPKLYDHIPLEPVLSKLYNLQEISLVFGINNLEENYDPRYFEFTIADCESLCRGLANLEHLKIIRINRSNLDCPKVKIILQRLIKKDTIEELDFSHCKIGDYGMKAMGGFIFLHKHVKRIRLANNRFKEEGIQGVAYALQTNPAAPIELIDFSLNPMSLQCATMFAAAFVRCKEKPQTLIVNSCGFRGASAEKMVGLLSLNRGLRRLEIAVNDLSGEAEETLVKSLEKNRNILSLDLRQTNISPKTEARVNELLERNHALVGVEREPSEEIPPLYLNEPEYLVWEYNPNNPDHIPGRYPERIPEL